MKYIIFTLVSLSLFSMGFGQNHNHSDCATEATPNIFDQYNIDSLRNVARTQGMDDFSRNIKLFVKIIREDDGSNGVKVHQKTAATVNSGAFSTGDLIPSLYEELQSLADYYASHDICFTFVGHEFIDDSDFASNTDWSGSDPQQDAIFNDLIATYPGPSSNVITAYILPQDRFFRGRANGIGSKEFVMYAGRFTYPHMAHEMGHCLNMYHTFETFFGTECPNGSNSSSAGDFVGDTPADDPAQTSSSVWSSSPCSYTGGNSTTCSDGVTRNYNPNTDNIMSYAPWTCRDQFTAGQSVRARDLFLVPSFSNVLVTNVNLTAPTGSISSGYLFRTAERDITTQSSSTTTGMSGSAVLTYTAGESITLRRGFVADPSSSTSYFNASINTLCGN